MTPVDPDTLPFDEFMVWLDGYIKQRDAWAQAEEPKRRRKKKREIAADLTTRGAGSKWSVCPATFTEAGRVRMPPMAYGPGCYAIYADGRLVYIGMSDKMNVRVAVHLSKHAATLRRALGEDVRHWTVKYRPERFYGERAMLELRLLRRLKPVLNRRGNGGGWNDQERPPVNQNNYRARAS